MGHAKLDLYMTVLFEATDGNVECSLKPKHPKIKRVVHGIIEAMGKRNSFREYEIIGEAASRAWEALDSFNLVETTTWDALLNGTDVLNLNRLVKSIVLKLEHELPQLINPNTRRMYDPETGGNMFVTAEFESLDKAIYDVSAVQIGTIGDGVSESFFGQSHDYSGSNPFLEWFRDNRHDFLTARQNAFIDALSVDTAKDTDYVEDCDFRELAGMDRTNLTHLKKRIYERTMKAWKEGGTSRRETYLLGEIAKWKEFIAIGESDDDLTGQNERLSAWIKNQELEFGEDAVDFVYDALAGDMEATKGFVNYLKGEVNVIDSKFLYDIFEAVELHVENLKAEVEAYVPTAPIMPNREAREINMFRKKRHKEFTKTQPTYVYNREGEYIRTIDAEESKTYKITKLDTFGMTHEIE